MKHFISFYAAALVATAVFIAPAQASEPQWQVGGQWRFKGESLSDTVAAGTQGSDQLVLTRLLVSATVTQGPWQGTAELLDSRTWLDDSTTPIGTGDINTLEPLQLNVRWQRGNTSVKVGRMTADFASRRLISRSNNSNVPHSFAGVSGKHTLGPWRLHGLYLLPMQRRTFERADLDANRQQLDRTLERTQLWALGGERIVNGDQLLRAYLVGLDEDDERGLSTRQRDLVNIGLQWRSPGRLHQPDMDVEVVYQHGDAKLSAADSRAVDHRAWMAALRSGYQFREQGWHRVFLNIDYASGDERPGDGESNRFDRLYGSTGSDFGPPMRTFNPFTRENILTPSLGVEYRNSAVTAFVAYREVFLAEGRDRLRGARLQDPSGRAGDHAGSQLEARLRIQASKQVRIELGGAYLIRQEFMDDAPGAEGFDDPLAAYGQVEYYF